MIRRLLIGIAMLMATCLLAPGAAQAQGFGFVPGSVEGIPVNKGGSPDLTAGSHPWVYDVHFAFKTIEGIDVTEGGEARHIITELPPGLIGNPESIPKCPRALFEGQIPNCPTSSEVGTLHVTATSLGEATGPVYLLEAPPGSAAQLGFSVFEYTSFLEGSLRTDGDYGINVSAFNVPLPIVAGTVRIWGNPADPEHISERYCRHELGPQEPGCASEAEQTAFFTLPTDCQSVPEIRMKASSVQAPTVWAEESGPAVSVGGQRTSLNGCEGVPFSPAVAAAPTTSAAEGPAGLDFELKLPNAGLLAPSAIAETEPVRTDVTLPQGVTVNPSAAAGIAGCSLEQYRQATVDPGTGCPGASKLGTLVAKSPLLNEPIEGGIYLAAPHDNPFGSLLALYIIARVPQRGVVIKQAGVAHADPITGQLSTTFDNLPPVPYSSFEVSLREGPRAPLITPQTCGEYRTVARLYPFSNPTAAVERTVPFKITSGSNGGACASSEAQLPASPTLEAGSISPLAGTYAPFVFRIKRADGEQRISAVSATLPTGLLARLKGVPFCSDAAIAIAASRTHEGDGALENASPSCPATSQVGVVNVAAGAGPQPYYAQGKVYMAGPYKGAPLSVEIITPAVAGPFDLGSVAVRTALYVNESTAQVNAVSDPLPTILHGIPLDVRTVSLQMDRREFTLNPTNCESKSVAASISTIAGATAKLSNHFAVGGCKGLAFKPSLKLAFTGQMMRTGNPAVKAVLAQPKSQNANAAAATVILPKGMFIDQAHINDPCTKPVLIAGNCPKSSVYGRAKAWTPLLNRPLEGNVYLVGGYGYKLPALVADLNGQIRVLLVGKVDTNKQHGLRNTFQVVPDCSAPYSKSFCKNLGKSLKFKLEKSSASESSDAVASQGRTASNDLVSYDRSGASASGASLKGSTKRGGYPALTATVKMKPGEANIKKIAGASASGSSLSGSTKRGGHPALTSVLTMKPGEANIARASVTLPASEFIDNAHIGNPCTRPVFAEEKCPKVSVLGRAKVWTPLLDKPLEGNVYFRSNGGERELPDLVVALRGQIDVNLVGFIDSQHHKGSEVARLRTTFATVPDAPVSKFVLELKGGKEGLLVNSANLCKVPNKAIVKLTGQNGKTYNTEPAVANSCGAKKAKNSSKRLG
jgi:hypothetical protein